MFYADNIINNECLYLNVMKGKAYKSQHEIKMEYCRFICAHHVPHHLQSKSYLLV